MVVKFFHLVYIALIKTKILSTNIIQKAFSISTTVPQEYTQCYLLHFLDEKLNKVWFAGTYANLHGLEEPIECEDIESTFQDLLAKHSNMMVNIEVFYFDSENHTKDTTKFPFRLRFPIFYYFNDLKDFISAVDDVDVDCINEDILDDASTAYFTLIMKRSFITLIKIYGRILSDPFFRLDRIIITMSLGVSDEVNPNHSSSNLFPY